MDLGTNLRGFGHKPSWIWAQTGLEGPGFRFFTAFRRRRGARVQVFQRFCAQIHEGLCPNPRRFVPKSTKVCAQIHEGHEHYKGSRLRGFGHKPSWIWAQTFVDLGTNLRGFGHKPSWIWAQTFVDLGTNLRGFGHKPASKGQGSGFSTFFIEVFFLVFQVVHGLFSFFSGGGAPGFKLFTVFFFTGWRGQGSGFSLAPRRAGVQVFHWLFRFPTGCLAFS